MYRWLYVFNFGTQIIWTKQAERDGSCIRTFPSVVPPALSPWCSSWTSHSRRVGLYFLIPPGRFSACSPVAWCWSLFSWLLLSFSSVHFHKKSFSLDFLKLFHLIVCCLFFSRMLTLLHILLFSWGLIPFPYKLISIVIEFSSDFRFQILVLFFLIPKQSSLFRDHFSQLRVDQYRFWFFPCYHWHNRISFKRHWIWFRVVYFSFSLPWVHC